MSGGRGEAPQTLLWQHKFQPPILKSTSNTTGTIGEVLPWDKHVIKVDDSGRITKRSRRFLRVATGGMGNNASPSFVRLAPLVPATLIKTPSLSSPVSDPDHITLVLFPPLSLSSDRPSSPPPPLPSTTPRELTERVHETRVPPVLRRSTRNCRPAREQDPASGQWVAKGIS